MVTTYNGFYWTPLTDPTVDVELQSPRRLAGVVQRYRMVEDLKFYEKELARFPNRHYLRQKIWELRSDIKKID